VGLKRAMLPKLPPIAVAAIGGLVVGYSLHTPSASSADAGSPKSRQSMPAQPEIRKAIPVLPTRQPEPEIRKAMPVLPTRQPAIAAAPNRAPTLRLNPASSPVGTNLRTSPPYTYSRPSTPSYTRSPSIPGYYNRYYDYNYRPPVGEHYVHSYTRRDGTFVSGHHRTNRDDSFWNNYSSYGNINPHTGRTGYKLPRVGRSTGYKLPRVGGSTYGLRLH
jgi:hypothetical protein